MSLPALVSVDDLATWLGATFSEADRARAQAVLDGSSALVRQATGQTWTTDDDALVADLPGVVAVITKGAAARAWNNPTGAQRVEETAGPFGRALVWAGGLGVLLTGEELDQLSPFIPDQPGIGGLGSITMRAPVGTNAARIVQPWTYSQQFDGDWP